MPVVDCLRSCVFRTRQGRRAGRGRRKPGNVITHWWHAEIPEFGRPLYFAGTGHKSETK